MKDREYETLYEVEDVHWWYLGHRRLYASLLDRYCPAAARGRVLDAGCGTGGLTQWMRDKYGPERMVAMGVSEEALLRCGERGLEELLCSPVEFIPFPDASFDLVLSLNVLYHRQVSDDIAALREMHRALSTGGFLLINLPALSFLRGRHDEAVAGVRRYTASGLRRSLSQAGFEPVKLTYFVFTLLPLIAAWRLWSRNSVAGAETSDLWLPPAPLNSALDALLAAESRVAICCGLPLGSSIAAIARKGSGPARV